MGRAPTCTIEGLSRDTLDNARERRLEMPRDSQVTPSFAWNVDPSAPSSAAAATAVRNGLVALPDTEDVFSRKHREEEEDEEGGMTAGAEKD